MDSREARRESDLMMPEGLEAGLVGGVGVIVAYLVPDLLAGNWLRTPTLLGAFLLHGGGGQEAPVADAGLAVFYSVAHFAAWVVAGFVASGLLTWVEPRPSRYWLPPTALGVWIAAMVAIDAWLAMTALPAAYLWVGSLVGATAID
ncbi:MAG: hypothetical protein ACQGVC_18990, partial [Myxococcota bacterium]